MAIYPGSTTRLINTAYLSGAPIAVYNRVNLHVAVSESSSLYSYFNASGRPSSHFYVRRDGTSEQYVDTALRAEADGEGNDATISIETQGGTTNADSETWTDAQLTAMAAIFKWTRDVHGIRNQMASTSQTNDSSKGLSWHRLGINGNFPALPNPCAGRGQRGGGMTYSTSTGKLCPGCGKINQIPEIFARSGGSGPTPQPPNPNPPNPNPNPPSGGLAVDGFWGAGTTTRLQQVLGMQYVDGEVWYQYSPNAQKAFTTGWKYNWVKGTSGSPVIAEMQRRMGITADGVWGTASTNALQRRYYPNNTPDGFLAGPSNTVKRMQEALNRGEF